MYSLSKKSIFSFLHNENIDFFSPNPRYEFESYTSSNSSLGLGSIDQTLFFKLFHIVDLTNLGKHFFISGLYSKKN